MEKTGIIMDIEKMKKDYEKLTERYKLPNFNELAEDFDIEKIVEKETNFLLREIRRAINDKISAYLHLFETFLNPTNPPMFIFSMLKNASEDDRKNIKETYKKLAKFGIQNLRLDTIYNENKEADFIKKVYDNWQELKVSGDKILEKFEKDFDLNNSSAKKGYFG